MNVEAMSDGSSRHVKSWTIPRDFLFMPVQSRILLKMTLPACFCASLVAASAPLIILIGHSSRYAPIAYRPAADLPLPDVRWRRRHQMLAAPRRAPRPPASAQSTPTLASACEESCARRSGSSTRTPSKCRGAAAACQAARGPALAADADRRSL